MKRNLSNPYIIAAFVLPALILFVIFTIFPLIPTIQNSFFRYDGVKMGAFIGLENYTNMLTDPAFLLSVKNTVQVVLVQVLIAGPISLALALIISRKSPGVRRFFKIACFIPAVLNVTVICMMWKMILQPDWGLLDTILSAVGLESLSKIWLINESTSMWSVTIVYLWQFIGFNMILFYSGIKSIPESYLEAAKLEGANFFQQCILITIPLIQEIIKFVLILTVTGCMGMFAHVQVLTGGGPGDLTRTVVYQLYYRAFMMDDFGGANAIAVMYAMVGMLIFLLINKFIAKERIEYV